jgi:hypothetical protein
MGLGSSGAVADLTGVVKYGKYTNAALGTGPTAISARDVSTIDIKLTAATCTISLTNLTAGQYIGLIVRQDATGGRSLVVTSADDGDVPFKPNTLANGVTFAALHYDGTTLWLIHGNRIVRVYWHGDGDTDTYGDRHRVDVRTHIIAASADCDNPPVGSAWIFDVEVVTAGVGASIYPNDAARPQIAAGGTDGGVITTHTTTVAAAGTKIRCKTKTPGTTFGGAHGTLALYLVEEV